MLKILIVDDELLVRIGLKSTLDWEKHDFTLVGEAKNGKEAFELFHKYQPDILLTDISMPGITGLDLIRELNNENPQLQSIILTHYEDFSYAQEAVSLGVLDYILKSNLTSQSLLQVLEKARQKILSHDSSAGITSSFSEKKADFKLQKLDLEDLFSIPELTETEQEERIADIESALPFYKYLLVVFQINLNINDHQELEEKKKKAVEEVIAQGISKVSYSVLYRFEADRILFLVNFDAGDINQEIEEKILQLFRTMALTIKKYLNLYLLIGVSRVWDSLHEISQIRKEAEDAVKSAFFLPDHIAQFAGGPGGEQEEKASEFVINKQAVLHLIKTEERQQVFSYIHNQLSMVEQERNYARLTSLFTQLLDLIRELVDQKKYSNKQASVGYAMLEHHNFYSLYDYEAVKMYLLNTFSQLMDKEDAQGEEAGGGQRSYLIRRAMKYIKSNYPKNISLSNVADFVEVSRSYLSFLFKQELGVNFSFFLTQTRIEEAKSLLTNTNWKIYEIAENVGFESPYYFSKVFKEVTGLTCKEYRNTYFSEERS